MRTVVSSSLFGFVTLAAFALGGCSFSTEADGPAGLAAEDHGSSSAETAGIAEPELGPPALGSGPPSAIGAARTEVGPIAPNTRELVKVERSEPEPQVRKGKPGAPTAIGIAEPEPGPIANVPVAFAGCTSDAECGTPECYDGIQESFYCDDAGACQVQIDSCGAYACGDSACATECRSDADCSQNASCQAGRCEES